MTLRRSFGIREGLYRGGDVLLKRCTPGLCSRNWRPVGVFHGLWWTRGGRVSVCRRREKRGPVSPVWTGSKEEWVGGSTPNPRS